MLTPSALDWLIRRVAQYAGPVVLVPKVTATLVFGLFCLTICSPPRIRSWTTAFSNSSVFSMSKSTTAGPTPLMTCWTAPAKSDDDEQFGPSLLPDQPPKEIWTLPPASLMAEMVCASTPPVTGLCPSHIGVQPPPDS